MPRIARLSKTRPENTPAAIALAFCLSASASLATVAPDPVEGKWLGTVGPANNRIEVGLEFRRNDAGDLQLFLTQPVSNYFGAALDGAVQRDGDRVLHPGMGVDLVLRGDRLDGTYPGPRSPAAFARATALPVEVPPPAVPTGPGPRWQTRLNGQVFASPVVVDGMVYVGSTGGVFQAVRARDGEFVWTFAAGRPVFGDALVTADAVYFVCDNGYLFKLERSSGRELWRYDLGDGRVARILGHPHVFHWEWQAPQPVLGDGVVLVGAADGGFHAVDAASGAARWRVATGGRIANAAALDGARVFVGSADHWVYALDRQSGKELWKFDTGAAVDATPVVHDGKVLVGNRGYGVIALAAATGERLWGSYFWGSWVESTPVVAGGVVYIGSSDLRRVSALSPADGSILWRTDVYGWTWGTPLVVGDRVFAGAAGGAPYFLRHVASFNVLDRSSGRILQRWPLPEVAGAHQWGIGGSPALDAASGTVVVTTIEGGIYGFPSS